jgi:hypothetical protein
VPVRWNVPLLYATTINTPRAPTPNDRGAADVGGIEVRVRGEAPGRYLNRHFAGPCRRISQVRQFPVFQKEPAQCPITLTVQSSGPRLRPLA